MLASALEGGGTRWAVWHDPARSLTLTAAGTADAVAPAHLQPASLLRQACSAIVEHIDVGRPETPPVGLPQWFVGLPFRAGSRRPGSPWTGWPEALAWLPRWLLVSTGDRTFGVAHGDAARPGRLADELGLLAARAADALRAARSPGAPPAVHGSVMSGDAADRTAFVDKVREALNAGPPKVVVARAQRFVARRSGERMSALDTARSLRRRFPGCTTFCLGAPDGAAFVGATPELLVATRGRRVDTMALAGTGPRSTDATRDRELAEALLASPKERREHALVADAIRAALTPLCEGVQAPNMPRIRRLANVQHLETPITARSTPGVTLADLVGALHPTPAVCGHPRPEAAAWLAAHETMERGWYAGPIGWIDPAGGGAFHVALRSALLRGASAWAFAGAGIVAGSEPEREWTETAHKLDAVGRALVARGEGGTS